MGRRKKNKIKARLYDFAVLALSCLLFLLSIFLILSFITYDHKDPSFHSTGQEVISNMFGSFGSYPADFFIVSIGISAFLFPIFLMALSYKLYRHKQVRFLKLKSICFILASLSLAISVSTVESFFHYDFVGGVFGSLSISFIADLLNIMNYDIIAYVSAGFAALFLLLAVGFTPVEYYNFFKMIVKAIYFALYSLFICIKPIFVKMWYLLLKEPAPKRVRPVIEPKLKKVHTKRKVQKGKKIDEENAPTLNFGNGFAEKMDIIPPLSLLDDPKKNNHFNVSEQALRNNAKLLIQILNDYGVRGEVVDIKPGPVVTLYELEPAAGIKASRVIALSDDIALKMSAISVRVASIPGRKVIGIEIPNEKREIVYLKELVASHKYENTLMKIPLILGKDITGNLVLGDLAKMPHLLVAGTTGSGKSVAVNTMILSLIYKMPPEKCRMIMIDPKMLELSIYDNIPHLLTPVVTDSKKAVVALKWAVHEMEKRYMAMSKLKVRNLEGYNKRIRTAIEKGEVITNQIQTGFDSETGKPIFTTQPLELKELPYIVIIVDEFADLMMVAGKEIDACIQRLAQMARAAGIHMIMATQRPSVDVVTGTIKANFPTRISFAVSSKIDSRTILNEGGAENLLGMGDMLYLASGHKSKRLHGPFVDDKEVQRIVKFLKSKSDPIYIDAILKEEENDDISFFGHGADKGNSSKIDALYDEAVKIVMEDRRVSTSYIQRKLSIGYNRAAKIVDEMENQGLISPASRTGKREILI